MDSWPKCRPSFGTYPCPQRVYFHWYLGSSGPFPPPSPVLGWNNLWSLLMVVQAWWVPSDKAFPGLSLHCWPTEAWPWIPVGSANSQVSAGCRRDTFSFTLARESHLACPAAFSVTWGLARSLSCHTQSTRKQRWLSYPLSPNFPQYHFSSASRHLCLRAACQLLHSLWTFCILTPQRHPHHTHLS